MDWNDEGFVLSARPHGENALIVSLLTLDHGRHAGLVRGGASARSRGIYQPGNLVRAQWRARLAEHLGSYRCELEQAIAAIHMHTPLPLLALSAATTLMDVALPERESAPFLYGMLEGLLGALGEPGWQVCYVRWELQLLGELGFGLDLSECAVTGTRDDLVFVSPKSGRAVSIAAAQPYRDRLLPLPSFLSAADAEAPSSADIADGLALTGYFLKCHVLGDGRQQLPAARQRLADEIRKRI
ncbi:MAG: DNA repair protein RecO [Proteobacteria bacterium]|nr:DNA repair protein RecO [Pseudomonadota bacterium]